MVKFFPEQSISLIIALTLLVAEFTLGYILLKGKGRLWISWLFPVLSVTLLHLTTLTEPGGFRMIALILVLLIGMKVVMAVHYQQLPFTLAKWFMYCFAWVGMNPELFFKVKTVPDHSLLYRGLIYLTLGTTIIFIISSFVTLDSIPSGIQYYPLSLLILIAFSQILHFGVLNINAFLLQKLGFPAYSLFRAPLQASSLRDFWGKRWNLAFTEMTSITVFRPLSKRVNEKLAMLASFIFSGVLHEVALSLPVNSGYGLPMLYFLIQLCLTISEQYIFRKRKPGIIWVISCLLLPLPILFHSEIMDKVFWKIFMQ